MWKHLHGGKDVEVFLTDILLHDMTTIVNIYQGNKSIEQTLTEKRPLQGQSPFIYIFQLLELTKLAYPSLSEKDQIWVAGDYFVEKQASHVRKVLLEMRRDDVTLMELAGEVMRLQNVLKNDVSEVSGGNNEDEIEVHKYNKLNNKGSFANQEH